MDVAGIAVAAMEAREAGIGVGAVATGAQAESRNAPARRAVSSFENNLDWVLVYIKGFLLM